MQEEQNQLLEEAFQYFKNVRAMSIIKNALRCINPKVTVEYDMEMGAILIDDYLSCYIPTEDENTFVINQQLHDPGNYHEPPSYDERLLGEYGSALELKFYEEIVKFYTDQHVSHAKQVIEHELDYYAEKEYLEKITG